MSDEYNFSMISLNLDTSAPSHPKKNKVVTTQANTKGNFDKRAKFKQKTEGPRERTGADDYDIHKFQFGTNKKKKRVERGRPTHSKAQDQGQAEGDGDKQFGKHRKTDGIISSLFHKNPEIPHIESSKVDVVSEEVFAGKTFGDLPLHPYLVSTLQEKLGFTALTQVQKRAIPVILERKDALIRSQTGSGKTLAYAVPIIQSIQAFPTKVNREDGPYALVIVPTRELAIQTYDILVKILRTTFIWIVPGCLMGGEKKKAEKARLRKGVNILVTTPGRLLDHINTTNSLSLARINWLVIDEADRLLELGYERDVAQILNALNEQNTSYNTVLLSATLSKGVERLSSITLKDPTNVSISPDGDPDDDTQQQQQNGEEYDLAMEVCNDAKALRQSQNKFSVPSQLNQFFIVTPCKLRLVTLASWILWKCRYTSQASKMIVFMSTQNMVEFHWQLFTKVLNRQVPEKKKTPKTAAEAVAAMTEGEAVQYNNIKEDVADLKFFHLHGEMKQKERTETFHNFSQAKYGILLCTDVAARGLDLPRVDWIVQYTLPGQTVDYIHRIGRTARAGTQGQSLLFLLPSEVDYVKELNNKNLSLSSMESSKMLRNLLAHISDFQVQRDSDYKRQPPRTTEEAATFLQDRFEEILRKDHDLHEIAGKGFQSYIRAYSTYSKEVKAILKARELHLGHVAKSFGLREAPSKVHRISAKTRADAQKESKDKKMKNQSKPLTFRQAALSEYSSGFGADRKKHHHTSKVSDGNDTFSTASNNALNRKFKRRVFDDGDGGDASGIPPVKKPKNSRIVFD